MYWVIGMMGTGKSTVAALAAKRLSVPFYDTDQMVVAAAGRPISDIWSERGEQGFRALERAAVADVPMSRGVAAAGGGAPLDRSNAERMAAGESVVWLRCELPELVSRLAGDGERPLLGRNPASVLGSLLEERSAVYSAVSTTQIDTTHLTPDEVGETLVSLWNA